MSSRTDQGLPAKITDPALLDEGARILSSAGAREAMAAVTSRRPGAAPSRKQAS